MFQFIALVWSDKSAAQEEMARRWLAKCMDSGTQWVMSLRTPGFVVMSTAGSDGARVVPLHDGCGVVLGHLFRNPPRYDFDETTSASGAVTELGAVDSLRILKSGGRSLVEHYWGDYVAFLAEPSGSRKWILRGPASAFPCLHLRVDSVDVYFSYMETIAGLLEESKSKVSINWKHVARMFVGPARTASTGLNEVRELVGGQCDEHAARECDGSASRPRVVDYWHPLQQEGVEPIAEFSRAAEALRACVRTTTHARASPFRKILVATSGGLDSSIVLASLQGTSVTPDIVCVNHFAAGPDSDERHFARLAAEHAGCELIEVERTDNVDLRRMLSPVRLESCTGFRTPDIDRIDTDIARRVGAQAIFKGYGGDELFCRHHASLYLVDLLTERGLCPEFLALSIHTAVLEGESFWAVASRAILDSVFPRRINVARIHWRDQEHQTLLNSELLESVLADEPASDPAPDTDQRVPPGRTWQASMVLARRPYHTPFSVTGDPDIVAPLLSQPVIELCLRIPTWLQMADKRDRAVARAAFANDLPRQIITRSGKGGAESLGHQILMRNMTFAREMLMDGELARHHIVDRARLEAALSFAPSSGRMGSAALLELMGVEAWLWAWRGSALAGHENTCLKHAMKNVC